MAEQTLEKRTGWALFVGGFFSLLFTEKPAGFVRDESVYFAAAESHARWFKLLFSSPATAFSDGAIVQAFDFNHEHPALMKNLFGLSYLLFHEGLGLLRPAAALRVPAFLAAAAILPLIYVMMRPLAGRVAAIFAAVSFLLVPRQFFEAHLACFDVPVTAAWLFVVFCFWQAFEKPRWWVYAGLAFGLAIGTKHNAFFIPVLLVPFSLWRGWERSKGVPEARTLLLQINGVYVAGAAAYGLMVLVMGAQRVLGTFILLSPHLVIFVAASVAAGLLLKKLYAVNVGTFRAVAPLVAMAVLGPVIFYLHWPYLWHHPVDRAAWYFTFHLTHNHYTWFYLGELLREPPFPLDYVVVVTAMTVPAAFFVPMVLGLGGVGWRVWKREVTLLEVLIVVNAVASVAIISQPDVPHFGGVKHWFPSMPFLAMLMGIAVERGATALHGWRPLLKTREQTIAAVAVLCCLSALIASWRVYPYGTSFYSEPAGGLPGGASLGMQRQFWANNVTGVLEWINQNARPGERVYLHECHGGQIRDYQKNGMLRTDLGFVGDPFSADLVAYQYHQEFREHEFNTWQALGTTKPVTGLYVDETPQVVVYRRR
ncbi:MAG: glycosyltransferase family 39 protein [Myxococcaceae bacterium]|nr:glycosyltransferase family 39 protein [Myxococcaceae bacterium]